jgi:hypothetical protein
VNPPSQWFAGVRTVNRKKKGREASKSCRALSLIPRSNPFLRLRAVKPSFSTARRSFGYACHAYA